MHLKATPRPRCTTRKRASCAERAPIVRAAVAQGFLASKGQDAPIERRRRRANRSPGLSAGNSRPWARRAWPPPRANQHPLRRLPQARVSPPQAESRMSKNAIATVSDWGKPATSHAP